MCFPFFISHFQRIYQMLWMLQKWLTSCNCMAWLIDPGISKQRVQQVEMDCMKDLIGCQINWKMGNKFQGGNVCMNSKSGCLQVDCCLSVCNHFCSFPQFHIVCTVRVHLLFKFRVRVSVLSLARLLGNWPLHNVRYKFIVLYGQSIQL